MGLLDTLSKLASPLGVIGDIGSSIFNVSNQADENQKNRDFQAQQASLAYHRQVELWNKQNQYNSPAAQMARFAAAGLNPNLIYGQQQQGASPSSVPQASSGASSSGRISNPFDSLFQNYMSLKNFDLDSSVKQSEIEANRGRSLLYDAQIQNVRSDTARQEFDLQFNKKVEQYRLELESLGVPKVKAETIAIKRAARKTELENSALAYQNQFAARTMESRIRSIDLGNSYLIAQKYYLENLSNKTAVERDQLKFINNLLEDEEGARRLYRPDGSFYYTPGYSMDRQFRYSRRGDYVSAGGDAYLNFPQFLGAQVGGSALGVLPLATGAYLYGKKSGKSNKSKVPW